MTGVIVLRDQMSKNRFIVEGVGRNTIFVKLIKSNKLTNKNF